MKLLFVENRYTTRVFERVANGLRAQGHGIVWVVQNHRFAPAGWPGVHRLPYPGPADLQTPAEHHRFADLARIDRGIRYFGGNANHYAHYARHIAAVLDEALPDVVFGESTQFHELIMVALCRDRGIPFLHPAATRIPHGRISFFVGDTLDTLAGAGQALPEAQALEIVDAVAGRRYAAFTNATATQPDASPLGRQLRRAADKLTLVHAWLEGERFVTPSPWVKQRLERQCLAALAGIDALAAARPFEVAQLGRYVLYAMQMQPETNIDVWGAPHHDQARIIARAARALADTGRRLVVKLNPTAKYELLEPGLNQALALPNVSVAPRGMPMAPLLAGAQALLSVTGSVIYECIFAGKPVCVLGRHALSRLPGATALDDAAQVAAVLPALQAQADGRAHALHVVQGVVRTSYPGTWFDPLTMGQYDNPDNLRQLTQAFSDLLAQLGSAPAIGRPVQALATA